MALHCFSLCTRGGGGGGMSNQDDLRVGVQCPYEHLIVWLLTGHITQYFNSTSRKTYTCVPLLLPL